MMVVERKSRGVFSPRDNFSRIEERLRNGAREITLNGGSLGSWVDEERS